jgi:hypothetical protein
MQLSQTDNLHVVMSSFSNTLEKNEVDIHCTPLEAFDEEYDADAGEEVDEEAFDAAQAGKKDFSEQSTNYTEVYIVC